MHTEQQLSQNSRKRLATTQNTTLGCSLWDQIASEFHNVQPVLTANRLHCSSLTPRKYYNHVLDINLNQIQKLQKLKRISRYLSKPITYLCLVSDPNNKISTKTLLTKRKAKFLIPLETVFARHNKIRRITAETTRKNPNGYSKSILE